MKKYIKHINKILPWTLGSLATLASAQAMDPNSLLKNIAQKAQYNTAPANPQRVIVALVNMSLGFVGLILVIIIIYAGFQWLTSQGNDEKIKIARKTLTNSAIGLLIVMAAYAIARYLQWVFFRSIDTGYYGF